MNYRNSTGVADLQPCDSGLIRILDRKVASRYKKQRVGAVAKPQ